MSSFGDDFVGFRAHLSDGPFAMHFVSFRIGNAIARYLTPGVYFQRFNWSHCFSGS